MRHDSTHHEIQAMESMERAHAAPAGPEGTADLYLAYAQVYATLANAAAIQEAAHKDE